MSAEWVEGARSFLRSMEDPGSGACRSVPDGPPTLYGLCYALLGRYYLGDDIELAPQTRAFIAGCQSAQGGLLVGPELRDFAPPPDAVHDLEHLQLHSTCAALPFCQQFDIALAPLDAAHRFCDPAVLDDWLARRDLKAAWLEGNNLLFVGQLLVYLRDGEGHPDAADALNRWFDWLDRHVDPETGLWGTDRGCPADHAVYGGYHQLLVYYAEDRALTSPRNLVDTVLSLQHRDGGFDPRGRAGACEDVDAVDILVNCYKRVPYRRAEIRHALKRCLRRILATQNGDGGFSYRPDEPQNHMGLPGTQAAANISCTFPTWFRIHTLALIAEILPEARPLRDVPFRFNQSLGMGWHESPADWTVIDDHVTFAEWPLIAKWTLRRWGRTVQSATIGAAAKRVVASRARR